MSRFVGIVDGWLVRALDSLDARIAKLEAEVRKREVDEMGDGVSRDAVRGPVPDDWCTQPVASQFDTLKRENRKLRELLEAIYTDAKKSDYAKWLVPGDVQECIYAMFAGDEGRNEK